MARITVEDCLKRVPNRFALAVLAARRAKQLYTGAVATVDTKGNRPIVASLREIEEGQVRFMTEEEVLQEAKRIAELAAARVRVASVESSPPSAEPNGEHSSLNGDRA